MWVLKEGENDRNHNGLPAPTTRPYRPQQHPYQPHPSPSRPHPQPLSKGRGEWYALLIDRLLLANSSTNDLAYSSTPQPFVHFSNSRQLVNQPSCVHFSANILTLWLRFFPPIGHQDANNRFSRRFVLM